MRRKQLIALSLYPLAVLLGIAIPVFSQNGSTRKITVVFQHWIGNTPLELGKPVTNVLGNEIIVERFRYYVSGFSVITTGNRTIQLPEAYFLVDEEDSSSRTIGLVIPDIPVTGIQFLLGVDSIKNVSGVQTGVLDPLQGMFWTWNTGYIMAKLEGVSPEAATAGHRFTYHIGGFREGMNTAKKITLPFHKTVERVETLHIKTDIDAWFKGNTLLQIAETPVCHSPGALAVRIADNYSRQFSLLSIQ